MGYELEDDFNEDVIDVLKEKYPLLYEQIDSGNLYLSWENSEDTFLEGGKSNNKLLIHVFVKKDDGEIVGTIEFAGKIYYNENGEWSPGKILKKSVKFYPNKEYA